MKKTLLLIFLLTSICSLRMLAQDESGATKLLVGGHTQITAVMDTGRANIGSANFSAIFLYQLSDKLFVESEIEIESTGDAAEFGLEHANVVWMVCRNVAFHAGRFVPHFGMYRGRLGEGFMNRFPTHPVGSGDGGIGAMVETGFGLQGGFAAGYSKFNYDLWLSDGPHLDVSAENAGQFDYEAFNDNNKNKALGGRIGFLPFSNSCLELGFSYENAAKTEDQYSLAKSVGVRMLAIDANFYHKIDFLKSTLRINGEYKQQDVDKYDYPVPDDTTGATLSFNNSSNAYYAMASIRPTGSENAIVRNFELAFRYSQYTTPIGAPWGAHDQIADAIIVDPVTNIPLSKVSQTTIALDYWLKWNCLIKLAYQTETNVSNKVFLQLYYGF